SRVLKKGGVYFYDTINRTFRSNIVAIRLLQQWRWSRIFPEDLHDWKMFIKPRELQEIMSRHGIESPELVGISPGATLFHIIRAARRHKRGEITISEMGRQLNMRVSRDTSISYMGYGVKISNSN